MAPIAMVIHGLFLLIPLSPEQKAREPDEKKEELQPIGSIAQLPPNITSAVPSPEASASPTPIAQSQQQPVVVSPIAQQQPVQTPIQQQPVKAPVQTQPVQTPVQQPVQTPVQTQPIDPTSETILSSLPGVKQCQSRKSCYLVRTQEDARRSMEAAYGKAAEDLLKDDSGGDTRKVGFKIENKKGITEYFYWASAIQLQKMTKELTTKEEFDNLYGIKES